MIKNELISTFDIKKMVFNKTHTLGSVLSFSNPCIGYIIKGSAQILYNGHKYIVNEGSLIYIAMGTKYYSIWNGNPDIEFYSIHFSHSNPTSFSEYRFQIIENYSKRNFLDFIYENRLKKPLESVGCLYMLLSDLFSVMKKCESTHASCIMPATEYIESHYTEDIKIKTLARICGFSEAHFYSLFKKHMGVSPITYKHSILIQHALYKLEHTTQTIDSISEDLGFSSPNYFRKVFMKITGITPKSVRIKGK